MSQSDRDRVWERRAEESADNWTYHPYRTAVKWIAGIVVAIFLLSVVSNAVGITGIYWGAEKAKLTAEPRVTQQVYQPNNIVAQIAFFHDQCEQVNAGARIASNNEARYQADLKAAKYAGDPIRQQQAQDALQQDEVDVAGAQNVLQTRAADYNSRSAQRTANPFKDAGLPIRIEVPTNARDLVNFQVNCGPAR